MEQALSRVSEPELGSEEAGRLSAYVFLSQALVGPLRHDLESLTGLLADDKTPLGRAFAAMRPVLAALDQDHIAQEYHDLFIGVGRGELLPYGSYYLTGFLNEKPLAELRRDMALLGFERAEGVSEPEDHIASLCEIMTQLITGTATGEFDIYEQQRFFAAHLAPWAGRFFADLEAASAAGAYRSVAAIGRLFLGIEEAGFEMLERA